MGDNREIPRIYVEIPRLKSDVISSSVKEYDERKRIREVLEIPAALVREKIGPEKVVVSPIIQVFRLIFQRSRLDPVMKFFESPLWFLGF